MVRYRKYPKYVSKIEIDKSWADKLKKQSSQNLTLLINQVTSLEKEAHNFHKIYYETNKVIDDANHEIEMKRIYKQQEIDDRSFGLKKAFNKHIANFGNTSEQDNEIRTAIKRSRKIRNLIDEALIANKASNKFLKKGNLLLKEINQFLADSDYHQKPFEMHVMKREDFYNECEKKYSSQSKARVTILPLPFQQLKTAKKSFYEIRKIINKKEKSAKLASYQDKSRNVGKSVMSKMKSEVSSPFYCPYCFKKTPKTKIHVDHINPVSNGGLSVERNLVPVCSDCNLNKSDLSLRAFCKKNSYDFDLVCNTLEDMGKFI